MERDGKEELLKADTYVFSMGMKSNSDEVEALQKAAGDIKTWVIGDALKAGKVADAVHGGHIAALEIV